jgi:hypothetical protein
MTYRLCVQRVRLFEQGIEETGRKQACGGAIVVSAREDDVTSRSHQDSSYSGAMRLMGQTTPTRARASIRAPCFLQC